MINKKSVLIVVAVITILSFVGLMLDLIEEPGNGNTDSYGTRQRGMKGLFETMQNLDLKVKRGLAPPNQYIQGTSKLVLWAPNSFLVDRDSDYLRQIKTWVEAGGSLIIATDMKSSRALELVGLDEVTLKVPEHDSTETEHEIEVWNDKKIPKEYLSVLSNNQTYRSVAVRSEGTMAALGNIVNNLSVPENNLQFIESSENSTAVGRIEVESSADTWQTIVEEFAVGNGNIIICSDPSIIYNTALGTADNAVLAVNLFADDDFVVFDEFFHGLTIQGNILWFLLQPNFLTLFGVLMFSTCIWIWRERFFLGPPLQKQEPSRRTVQEYIDSMGNLFLRGKCYRFILSEYWGGTLWLYREQLQLSKKHNAERIADSLARKHPEKAEQLRKTAATVNLTIHSKKRIPLRQWFAVAKEISKCR